MVGDGIPNSNLLMPKINSRRFEIDWDYMIKKNPSTSSAIYTYNSVWASIYLTPAYSYNVFGTSEFMDDFSNKADEMNHFKHNPINQMNVPR